MLDLLKEFIFHRANILYLFEDTNLLASKLSILLMDRGVKLTAFDGQPSEDALIWRLMNLLVLLTNSAYLQVVHNLLRHLKDSPT